MCSALDPIRFSPAWQVSDTSFTPLCRQSKFVSPELGGTTTNECSDSSSKHMKDQSFLKPGPSAIDHLLPSHCLKLPTWFWHRWQQFPLPYSFKPKSCVRASLGIPQMQVFVLVCYILPPSASSLNRPH